MSAPDADTREHPVLDALRHLGPATSKEIADHTGLAAKGIGPSLGAFERSGKVRRTGRMTGPKGDEVEWRLVSPNGHATPEPVAPAPAAPDRLRALADRLATANERIEELERELEELRDANRIDMEQVAFEHRVRMRERYYNLLLGLAAADGAEEHVFDRLERLIDAPSEA